MRIFLLRERGRDKTMPTKKYIVRVGLVTHNGEKYLNAQLKSIHQQSDCEIKITVVDTNSTDGTLEILNGWKRKGLIEFIDFAPDLSAKDGFVRLINIVQDDLPIAFSDQDDVWEKDKLKLQMLNLDNSVDLIASNRSFIDKNDHFIFPRRSTFVRLTWKNALVENVVYGNTILLSSDGLKKAKLLNYDYAIMYDSFLYLYFSMFGSIKYLNESLTQYRIHKFNTIGINNRNIFSIFESQNSFYSQNRKFYLEYKNCLPYLTSQQIFFYLKIFESNFLLQRIYYSFKSKAFRQNQYESFIWKILAPLAFYFRSRN